MHRRTATLTVLPLLAALTITTAPATAQSAGSADSPASAQSVGSATGSVPTDSLFGQSGPCNSFYGNLPPGSLGRYPATGSLADATNSSLDATMFNTRRFPRWISGDEGTIPALRGATTVSQLVTGPTSPGATDQRFDIHGTDLGIMFEHGDRTMALFGDTFGDCSQDNNEWRSNVMLATEGGSPDPGLTVLEAVPSDAQGRATALIQGAHHPNGIGEVTVIPTAAVSTDTAMYMRVMSVHDWNAPGGWTTNYSALARSTDDGDTWHILTDSMRRITDFTDWADSVRFEPEGSTPPAPDPERWTGAQMSAFLTEGDTLYEYVTPSGRSGGAMLARIPLEQIEDPDSYEWYTGNGWADDPTDHLVLPARVEELSVQYNAHLDAYLAMTPTSAGVVSARVAPSPEGPWSEPQTIIDRSMFPNGYAPMMHPHTSTTNSRYLDFMFSTWDAYNVFLLRTDLDAFDFSTPDSNPRTVVEGRVPVSEATAAGAVDPRGMVDEARLEQTAASGTAPLDLIPELPGK